LLVKKDYNIFGTGEAKSLHF